MHNCALSHVAVIVTQFLNNYFPDRYIGRDLHCKGHLTTILWIENLKHLPDCIIEGDNVGFANSLDHRWKLVFVGRAHFKHML